jgi:hyperosmotically inducible protein
MTRNRPNHTLKRRAAALLVALGVSAFPLLAGPPAPTLADQDEARIAESVRKQIVKLPFYGIYDHVQFAVEGDRVVLSGDVYRPSMKKSVERVAARVEGVNEVVNNLQVAPTSFYDDRLRLALTRAIYGNTVLSRLGFQANPPIHILVNNGDVTLEGLVNREMEKNIAGIVANSVPGVFSLTNNLRIERS